ncbi:MAG: hypothetical protein QOJ54_1734 [Aliidongia sp.]|jgi:hypothetical protein|nr:hypothetical protein [Aliidongia sp.]
MRPEDGNRPRLSEHHGRALPPCSISRRKMRMAHSVTRSVCARAPNPHPLSRPRRRDRIAPARGYWGRTPAYDPCWPFRRVIIAPESGHWSECQLCRRSARSRFGSPHKRLNFEEKMFALKWCEIGAPLPSSSIATGSE